MEVLRINNIKKSFDGLMVLKDISLSINKWEVVSIIGPSGSGKSTFVQKLAITRGYLKGRPVYANFDVAFARKIDMKNFGKYSFPENSLILLDEISLFYDNRNFKNFKQEITDYLRYQRHFKNEI